MSEVEKLKIGNTSYDIKDATAAHSLSDIATAGNNIEFQTPARAYTVVGSPTINSSYEASGFSDSNYITCPNIINNASSSFELITAVKISTSASSGIVDTVSPNYGIRLLLASSGQLLLRVSTDGSSTYAVEITGTTVLLTNTKYWIKLTYNSSTGYEVFYSTDGSSWTSEITSSVTTAPYSSASNLIFGDNTAGSGYAFDGTIYLADTSITVNGTDTWKVIDAAKTSISSTGATITVDQTYNSTSANAQSGIAIDGAGFLKNTGNSSYSNLGIIGTTNASSGRDRQVAIGYGARTNNSDSVAIGYNANSGSNTRAVAIGSGASSASSGIAIGYSSSVTNSGGIAINGKTSNGIAIGTGNTSTSTGAQAVAIGGNATGDLAVTLGKSTTATATNSISLGYYANTSAAYAIQLGYGTNSTANTFSVGLSQSNNYQLLDSSGHIPAARLTNAVQGALTSSSITLAAADWSANTQTVTVNGITSSSFIWVSPAAASASDYADAGVLCTAQATNSLTFTCDTTPSNDITVTIVFG